MFPLNNEVIITHPGKGNLVCDQALMRLFSKLLTRASPITFSKVISHANLSYHNLHSWGDTVALLTKMAPATHLDFVDEPLILVEGIGQN